MSVKEPNTTCVREDGVDNIKSVCMCYSCMSEADLERAPSPDLFRENHLKIAFKACWLGESDRL